MVDIAHTHEMIGPSPERRPEVHDLFERHREHEILLRITISNFIDFLKNGDASHTKKLDSYEEKFSNAKTKLQSHLKEIKNTPIEFLERECLTRHLEFVNHYLDTIPKLRKADRFAWIDITANLKDHHIDTKERLELRDTASRLIFLTEESGPAFNEYMWSKFSQAHDMLVINDMNIPDEELKQAVTSFGKSAENKYVDMHKNAYFYDSSRRNIHVVPFSELAKKLVDEIVSRNPDLIILPMRGAQIFMGMFPKNMRKKLFTYNISEHFPRSTRLESNSKLLERFSKDSPKKVVWLDDEVFRNFQSTITKELLDHFKPDAFEFQRFALAAHEPTWDDEPFFAYDPEILGARPIPALASKWLRFFHHLAVKHKDPQEAERILTLIKKSESHGVSGWV